MSNTDADAWSLAATQNLQTSQAAQIRSSLAQALPVNPDAEAQVRQSAATVGVPLATAQAMPEQINQQAQLAQFQPDVLQRHFPTTAQLLQDPNLARITHDDVPATTQVEAAVRAPAAPAPVQGTDPAPGKPFGWSTIPNYLASADGEHGLLFDLGSGVHSLLKGLGGAFNKGAGAVNTVLGAAPVTYDKITGNDTKAGDWWFSHMVTPAVNNEPVFATTQGDSFVDKGFHATGSLLGTLAQIILTGGAGEAAAPIAANDTAAAGVAKLVEHGVKSMTTPALTEAVNTGRDVYTATGGDANAAFKAATAAYGTTAAQGVIPISAEGGVLKRVFSGAISGMVSGEASRRVMNAALPADQQTPFSWENAFLSGATGAALGGVLGGRGEANLLPQIRYTYTEAYQAAKAEAQGQQLIDIAKAAGASKLRVRDPQAFKEFVAQAADGGDIQSVHIEGQAFAQMLEKAGISGDEIRQTMPEVAAQLDAALGENAPKNALVSVPIEDFATHIVGSKIQDEFLQAARVSPESATLGESESFKQTQKADLEARAKQIVDAHGEDAVYQASLDKMNAQVDSQLAGLKMRPDQLATNSTLLKEFYKTQAAIHGVLPHEFAERYPVFGDNEVSRRTPPAQVEDPEQPYIRKEIRERIASGKSLGVIRQGDGSFSVGRSNDAARHITLDLTPEERKQVERAHALDQLAETQEERGEARQALQDAVLPAAKRASAEREVSIAGTEAGGFEQPAYHGTPHDVDKFTTQKIGTGEGAQAYGWGMYFAGNKDVADYYRRTLSEDGFGVVKIDDVPAHGDPHAGEQYILERDERPEKTLHGQDAIDLMRKLRGGSLRGDKAVARMELAHSHGIAVEVPGRDQRGRLYKVEVPDDHNLLDYDARLKDQPEQVRAALEKLGFQAEVFGVGKLNFDTLAEAQREIRVNNLDTKIVRRPNPLTGKDVYEELTKRAPPAGMENVSPEEAASRMLDAAGVPGLRYLDGGSRGTHGKVDLTIDGKKVTPSMSTPAGESDGNVRLLRVNGDVDKALAEAKESGTPAEIAYLESLAGKGVHVAREGSSHNYVVFHDNNVGAPEVLNQKARGTYSPSEKTITLLKDANLSTFQHELGHYFLDTLGHLAAQGDAAPSVKADMATLLKWGGVESLDAWHEMGVDGQRELHEKFATAWETYLMKGQAPSLELRGLFQRFRAWMISVYKSLKGAPGDFTPEVRGVMDRMIASEDAIHQAEMARKYMPLFDAPEKSGMSPEEWAAYQAKGKDATEQAIEHLIGKTMKDMAKTDKLRTASLRAVQRDAAEKRKAITLEVRREVMSTPVYRAWSFLTGRDSAQLPDEINAEHQQALRDWSEKREEHLADLKSEVKAKAWEDAPASKGTYKNPGLAKGQWLAKNRARIDLEVKRQMLDYDGEHPKPKAPPVPDTASKDATTGAGKIDLEALREAVGKDAAKPLSDLRMTTATGKGLQPGEVADMFGFPDVESLVKAITETEPPRAAVEGIVDQRMLERHGEISSPEAMARTADELVQNEVRSTFVATELRALKKATGKPKEIVAAAKEAAQNTIGVKRIRDINEGQFRAAETRSATQAERAMMKGDTVGAAAAKRDQLLNMELGRAARDAKEFVVKALDYLGKFDKPSVREAIDVDYRDQIDALLERADLRKGVSGTALDKRATLQSWVEKMAAAGYKPDVPESLLNEAERWHYKDMPFDAFRGLVDSIKSIEHLGKLKEQLRDGQETRRIADLADEMRDTAAKLPQQEAESNRGLTRMESSWVKAKAFGRSAQASLLKMEQMFDWLDARNTNGVMNRVVFRRMSEAGVHENELLRATKQGIDELMARHANDITKSKAIYTADGLIDGATGKPQKFTTKEMLMLAGNAGNESNLSKLARGEKWSEAAVWDFLNKNMTEAHWDFVEGMGKTLEALWPEKVAMGRRLGETTPEKIAPRPFQTADGKTRSGWYWPLMYDPARSQDVAERGARTGDALFENIYSKPSSDTGRMNTRNENYARPILLDLDALPKMIKEEIHDIAWREAVIDADRFTSHPTVRKAIIESLSQEHYDQIRPWLQSLANDGKLGVEGNKGWIWMNKIASEARTRATMVGLGYRLTTSAVHGLSAGMESVAELGPVWFGKGLADFANPAQWAANKEAIFAKSGEMRNRADEVDRDIREHLRKIDTALMDPTSSALSRGADLLRSHAYDLIAGLDMATALPTWQGAYLKGMTPVEKGGLGLSEADAVYFADKTVRNAHGGTGVKDMAAIQRGNEFQKLFTMFYTFWNHNVNRLMDTAKLVGSAEHRAAMKEANHWSDSQVAATVILRTLVYTIGVQTMHALFHPPKDGDADSWFKYAAKEMGSVAFGGIPIARDIYAHYATGRDYSATPAAGIIDTVGKTGTDTMAALTGKQVDDQWVKHLVATGGVVFNLPTGQPANVAQFLWDIGNGTADPTSASDWYNGIMHGNVHHH